MGKPDRNMKNPHPKLSMPILDPSRIKDKGTIPVNGPRLEHFFHTAKTVHGVPNVMYVPLPKMKDAHARMNISDWVSRERNDTKYPSPVYKVYGQ